MEIGHKFSVMEYKTTLTHTHTHPCLNTLDVAQSHDVQIPFKLGWCGFCSWLKIAPNAHESFRSVIDHHHSSYPPPPPPPLAFLFLLFCLALCCPPHLTYLVAYAETLFQVLLAKLIEINSHLGRICGFYGGEAFEGITGLCCCYW